MNDTAGLEYIPGRGYFMTDEEKDTQLGRLTRERRESDEAIARLKSEAARLGSLLSGIGAALVNNPEGVAYEREGIDPRFSPRYDFNPRAVDFEKIHILVNDLRTQTMKRDQLRRELAELGYGSER